MLKHKHVAFLEAIIVEGTDFLLSCFVDDGQRSCQAVVAGLSKSRMRIIHSKMLSDLVCFINYTVQSAS